LHTCGERDLPSRVLGEWVMEELRQLDQVAYVRFASVYRSFQDINAFQEEIERLQRDVTVTLDKDPVSLLTGQHKKSTS